MRNETTVLIKGKFHNTAGELVNVEAEVDVQIDGEDLPATREHPAEGAVYTAGEVRFLDPEQAKDDELWETFAYYLTTDAGKEEMAEKAGR